MTGRGESSASEPGRGWKNRRRRRSQRLPVTEPNLSWPRGADLQAQNLRLARSQGPYYSGSLPNVNQIGRNAPDFQASFPSTLESSRATRHHGLVERVQRERRFLSPVRPYRSRPVDSSPYSSAYLSPPPDPSWRRNWSGNFPGDKSQLFRLPTTALNRTNSDSALHTSVMKPPPGDPFSSGAPTLRRSGEPSSLHPDGEELTSDPCRCRPGQSPVKSLESKPASMPAHGVPPALNTGGSLPDLSSLHFPSPLPTPLDQDEPSFPGSSSLSGGSSTGSLASTLTQLGLSAAGSAGGSSLQPHPQGAALSTSPRRRTQLSPLILPDGGGASAAPLQAVLPHHLPHPVLHHTGRPSGHQQAASGPAAPPVPAQPGAAEPAQHLQPAAAALWPEAAQHTCDPERACAGALRPGPPAGPRQTGPGAAGRGRPGPQLPPGRALPEPAAGGEVHVPVRGRRPRRLSVSGPRRSGPEPEPAEPAPLRQPGPGPASSAQQLLNSHNLSSSGEARHDVPNIILSGGWGSGLSGGHTGQQQTCLPTCELAALTLHPAPPPAGESPPGLSKEIANALSHVPGFEMDPFSLDESLRMDRVALDMLERDLMLADPAVEDSFRSDRFQ
ncbi:unnamed protein product [Tetraodon nigroviridis]|uniref:(spotted green pufferfish) hypothetical protein n=1 Tax=Tetraodon nigroviridis TaxID=99883 RepID=Q4SZS3_TETNG|nr:unnamed protein product [Tetraodon nigroviridis]